MTMPHVCQCGSHARVLESRETRGAIRRRRCCTSCGERWTTIEARIPDGVPYAASTNVPSFIWIPGSQVELVRRVLAMLAENLGAPIQEGP